MPPQDKAAIYERQLEGDGADLCTPLPDFLAEHDLRLDTPIAALRHPLNAIATAAMIAEMAAHNRKGDR